MGYDYPGVMVDLGHGRGWLDADAAASIRRIDAAIGHPLQTTETGRSFFTQEQHWLKYQRDGYPIALNPNTPSEHQKGKAVDSDEAQKLIALMEEHGWFRTVYRWVAGKWTLVERWHFEYFIARDKHRYSGGGAAGGEDEMNADQSMKLDAVYAALFGPANVGAPKSTWAKPFGEPAGEAYYGIFDVVIASSAAIAKNAGTLAALQTAVGQLSAGSGVALDMKAIEAAAERGAKDALSGLVLTAEVSG